MLGKSERLSRTVFSTYFRSGTRFQSPHLTVIYTPAPAPKGAVVVPKKVARSAVARNQIRRRLSHTLTESGVFTTHPGVYIIIAKAGAPECPRRALRTELIQLLARITATTAPTAGTTTV